MTIHCSCGAIMVWDEAWRPPDNTVACPNRRGRCGKFWFGRGREHWFPQLLRVRLIGDSV